MKEILDIVNVVVTIILHAVLQGKIANNRINILSIGINYYPIKNKNKNNKLGMSQPCNNCVKMLSSMPTKKGYIIKNIYYSDSNNNIIKTTLTKLQ